MTPFLIASLLFCVSSLLQQRHAGAAPVAPNISSCHLPAMGFPSAEPLFDCCAPTAASSSSSRLFRPSYSTSLRVRRPSHTASPSYAAKLARAYALMKALPDEDPRSFAQQANIHCAYCDAVYNQLNSTQLFQVHESWLFSPFHRWYLYFHERILAKLLDDDDTFALTFWNYDHHNATSIPWLFDNYDDTLVSFERDPLHRGPNATVAIDFALAEGRTQVEQQMENDYAMYRTLIQDASTPEEFFGSPYRQGDSPKPGGGSLEDTPHNNVHIWVGNKSSVGLKDMGSFYAAARDPVFYAHHAQLDRLWETWKTFPDHKEFEDEDYLDSEFVFYNEDADLVRVRVRDALNTTLLGYVYEDVEQPWVDLLLTNLSSGAAKLAANATTCAVGVAILSPCSIVLEITPLLQEVGRAERPSPWLHQRLQLSVKADPRNLGAHVDIYVNLPSADGSTGSSCAEFLYGLNSLTPATAVLVSTPEADSVSITARPYLYGRLADLGLPLETSIVVTLVPSFPRSGGGSSTPLVLVGYSTEYSPPAAVPTSMGL